MKKVYKDKILNIENTDLFDNKFLFTFLKTDFKNADIEVFDMWKLLLERQNTELLNNIWDKYAMFSNVYNEKDELEIFEKLFNYAISNNKKIHIIWVTLDEEIKILEDYYEKLWFLREDINCFKVDFSKPLVTVSVNIENLIWRWSDYKKMKDKIFFIPPVREAWMTKAMFKWINRWVISYINIKDFTDFNREFLLNCVLQEHVLPLTLSKVLYYNIFEVWFKWEKNQFELKY